MPHPTSRTSSPDPTPASEIVFSRSFRARPSIAMCTNASYHRAHSIVCPAVSTGFSSAIFVMFDSLGGFVRRCSRSFTRQRAGLRPHDQDSGASCVQLQTLLGRQRCPGASTMISSITPLRRGSNGE